MISEYTHIISGTSYVRKPLFEDFDDLYGLLNSLVCAG